MAHQDHGAPTRVLELVERAASYQCRHAGREHGQAAIGEAHGTFAFEAGENLILVVAMQFVMIARVRIIVDPRMQLARAQAVAGLGGRKAPRRHAD
jgi:hypothetical protein